VFTGNQSFNIEGTLNNGGNSTMLFNGSTSFIATNSFYSITYMASQLTISGSYTGNSWTVTLDTSAGAISIPFIYTEGAEAGGTTSRYSNINISQLIPLTIGTTVTSMVVNTPFVTGTPIPTLQGVMVGFG
jgi:hypothetical protein